MPVLLEAEFARCFIDDDGVVDVVFLRAKTTSTTFFNYINNIFLRAASAVRLQGLSSAL